VILWMMYVGFTIATGGYLRLAVAPKINIRRAARFLVGEAAS
jgi:hypothetical protein